VAAFKNLKQTSAFGKINTVSVDDNTAPGTDTKLRVGPKLSALSNLMDALSNYSQVWNSRQGDKVLESVVMYSLLLYARSNDVFSPSKWCERSTFGTELQLLGGAGVRLWKNITEFPEQKNVGSLDIQVQGLVERFEREREDAKNNHEHRVNGAIFRPTDASTTIAGDIYGLFMTSSGSYLLRFQCENRYGTTAAGKEKHLAWEKSKRVFQEWKGPTAGAGTPAKLNKHDPLPLRLAFMGVLPW
jgi:hypothetical protein